MRLDNLKQVKLEKATRTKQANGTYKNTYTKIMEAYLIHTPIDDAVSATIYGNTLNKMTRFTSKDRAFNDTVVSKLNNTSDNINLYYIEMDGVTYSIRTVRPYKQYITIDVEAI